MKDIKYIERFCKRFGIGFHKYTEPQFICEAAQKKGAKIELSLYNPKNKYGALSFQFDADGKIVGFSDQWRDSFNLLKKKKKRKKRKKL